MNLYRGFFLAGFSLVLASHANGQIVFQTPVAITQNASDISTMGTYVDAVGANGFTGTSVQVGDTLFNPFQSEAGITLSNAGGGTDGSGSNSTPFKTVLNGVLYTGNFNPADVSTAVVTLNNLKVGDLYQVQFFSLGGFATQVNGANSVTVTNAYTLGTFTALGAGLTTSQTFSFDSSISGAGEVNAIALRDLSTVPETSTYAMMLMGGAGLFLLARRYHIPNS